MMRFVHLFKMGELLALFDTDTKKWKYNRLCMGNGAPLFTDLQYFGFVNEGGTDWTAQCNAYESDYPDLSKAKFERNRIGELVLSDRPQKLTLPDFIRSVTPARRKVSAAQLGNLQKLKPEQRYQRPKIVTEIVIEDVKRLRADGLAWAAVSSAIGINMGALKVALHRQQLATEETR